jgi:hypothetical protein
MSVCFIPKTTNYISKVSLEIWIVCHVNLIFVHVDMTSNLINFFKYLFEQRFDT